MNWKLPAADTYFRPLLTARGFEIEKLDAALAHVRSWRTAVDGGAHIGTWSAALAERFEAVLAFEPAADTFRCLLDNVAPWPNVTPLRIALGASIMRAGMRDDPLRPGNTGALHVGEGADFEIDRLDSLRLDTLDFLKLDVEGYEYFALLGAEQTVRRCRPVVCMEVKDFGRRYGVETEAAAELLASWGAREVERMKNDRVYAWR